VLLDADVVIWLSENGIWDQLIDRARVALARTVVQEVDHYYDPATQAQKRISLKPYVTSKRIEIVDADKDTTRKVLEKCGKYVSLHKGELESVAYVAKPGSDALLCTGDGGAIRAMVLLDLNEQAVSLEEMLRRSGLARSFAGHDVYQFSEKKFRYWIKLGGTIKIQHFRPE